MKSSVTGLVEIQDELTNSTPKNSTSSLDARLASIRQRVAQPYVRGFPDPQPAILEGGVLIGGQHHAHNVSNLLKLGVTAVLNCASGGICRLPVDQMEKEGIKYEFTNVRQDHYEYPILHHNSDTRHYNGGDNKSTAADVNRLQASTHLQVAKQLYQQVVMEQGGKILFFCVAGMNRSTCLGIATLMLFGYSLDHAIDQCAQQRAFVLENQGFQVQLVQLEAFLQNCPKETLQVVAQSSSSNDNIRTYMAYKHADIESTKEVVKPNQGMNQQLPPQRVEIELLIPGLCTMDVDIPACSTIQTVKNCLIEYANRDLLRHFTATQNNKLQSQYAPKVAKSWLVLAMFGYDSMYDVPLEVEALDKRVQLDRIQSMFGLKIRKNGSPGQQQQQQQQDVAVEWTNRCRFALVIFSIYTKRRDPMTNSTDTYELPWTFLHEERPAAPATFLQNNLLTTYLRAWDFVSGQAYTSKEPIVFSHSSDSSDRRGFMKISNSANQAQQFYTPGEGGILGMGANAIVHRVQLTPTSLADPTKGKPPSPSVSNSNSFDIDPILYLSDGDHEDMSSIQMKGWDAAVKRYFSLDKMLAALDTEKSSEAGMAKRVRLANSLNPGRVLYFYGLGVAMSANMSDNEHHDTNKFEFRWEAILLARYEEQFSTYTMRRFMEDYIALVRTVRTEDPARASEVERLQASFSLLSVKILLVSLLNAFRDLTLMGVQAFDFNHLNNVLISRDHRKVQLIDIDGNSKGFVDVKYCPGIVHKPSLDVDLNAVLPTVIQQLLLGKGRGAAFVTNSKSDIWRAPAEKGKEMIYDILRENFYPHVTLSEAPIMKKHLTRVLCRPQETSSLVQLDQGHL